MENEDLIREIATKACREALQDYWEELAEDVARRMKSALEVGTATPALDRTKELRDGTLLIAGSRTQTEALEAVLSAASTIASGCGLLILRGGQAVGWNCHGLASAEDFRQAVLDPGHGPAAKVMTSGAAVAAQASEFDLTFAQRLGLKRDAQVLLLPVSVKERVAAFLIALSENSADMSSLEVLIQVTQLTLDLQVYRKTPAAHPHAEVQHSAAPDPHVATGQRREPSYVAGETRSVAGIPGKQEAPYGAPSASISHSYVAPHTQASNIPESDRSVAPAMDEAHEKARRFAKLLVEEIKLYNQAKVSEGRARGDLYSRLHEDIEKSRAAYQKRYGESVRDIDFFTQELIRILADNNRAVMGPGFPG